MRTIATIASLLFTVPVLAQEAFTAPALLTEARQCAAQVTDPLARANSWSAIARAEGKLGQTQNAKEAIRLAWSAANPDPKKKARSLWMLRDWAAFDLEGAKQAAAGLMGLSQRWAMEGIVSVQAQSGDLLGAFQTAQKLDDPRWALKQIEFAQNPALLTSSQGRGLTSPHAIQRGPTLVWQAGEALKKGERAKAEALLASAERVVRHIIDPETLPGYRLSYLRKIGELRSQLGETETGRKLLQEVKDSALGLPTKEQNNCLSQLALAQARTGDRLGALRTARGLEPAARAQALAGIAAILWTPQ
jgi:hypothetical protein